MEQIITIDTCDKLKIFIDESVQSSNYKTISEVVREGLRLLQEKQAESKPQRLQNPIQEDMDSGDVTVWNRQGFFNRMGTQVNENSK